MASQDGVALLPVNAEPTTRARIAAESLAVFVAVGAMVGAVVLPSASLVTIDGYYHFRIAELIGQQGPWVDIRWLPLTVLGDHGPDHHWLWHVLVVPFTWLPDPFEGLKWATVITAAAVPAALTWMLRRMGVPWAGLFALLAFCGAIIMPGRLLMLRAQNFAIVGMVAALVCLAKERHRLLALVAFAMMQAYHGAVMLVPMVLLDAVLRRAWHKTWVWRPTAAVAAGLSAGLLLSPWFPGNLDYLFFHTLYKLMNPQELALGSEWLSPTFGHILRESWPVWVALAIGFGYRLLRWPRHWDYEHALWGFWTLVSLVLYLKAWRFAEYFVPVSAACAGLLFRPAQGEPSANASRRWLQHLAVAAVAVVVVVASWRGVSVVERLSEFEPGKYGGLAAKLHEVAEPDDIVFNTVWEDFVFLFWHNQDVRYVNGLDPNYLGYQDPTRFQMWRWVRTVDPQEPNDPAPVIGQAFGAKWVVVDRLAGNLAERLFRSPHAKLVHQTQWGWLYTITLPASPPDS